MIEWIEIENPVPIKGPAWNNMIEAMDMESDERNFKYDFKTMTKKYGQAYMEFCRAAWAASDGAFTPEEFCKMNGDMPMGFFEKRIKT